MLMKTLEEKLILDTEDKNDTITDLKRAASFDGRIWEFGSTAMVLFRVTPLSASYVDHPRHNAMIDDLINYLI